MSRIKQQTLESFFRDRSRNENGGGSDNTTLSPSSSCAKRRRALVACGCDAVPSSKAAKPARRSADGSCFGSCPLCQLVLPIHHLQRHAAQCDGSQREPQPPSERLNHCCGLNLSAPAPAPSPPQSVTPSSVEDRWMGIAAPSSAAPAIVPGLHLYEEFITEDEEALILAQLDGRDEDHLHEFLPWKAATFNGRHSGKRWGVHCHLMERRVSAAEHPLPDFLRTVILPKLARLAPMAGCAPNEANAIEYRRDQGHWLKAHVDDRQLSKEPIANLSLAGDCYMTFACVRHGAVPQQHKVLLKRRTLQVLTGKARYDYSHAIENANLLSPRRISVTMRESPLTGLASASSSSGSDDRQVATQPIEAWWSKASSTALLSRPIRRPTSQPIPGLLLYEEFLNAEDEHRILLELDGDGQPWKLERHTGRHREKRFGVDSDLWSRATRAPKHAMPSFFGAVVLPKLERIPAMAGIIPNEGNAIDYNRKDGDWLRSHVDDRRKHKEPIANLSLAGACYMTFKPADDHPGCAESVRVLLQPRTLLVLTGKARYEYAHGIDPRDLLSERRVSFTMRETA